MRSLVCLIRRYSLTVAMAAFTWLQAGAVKAAEERPVVDKFPKEIQTLIKGSEDIAAAFSGITGTLDAAKTVLILLGVMQQFDQEAEFRKLYQKLDELGVALGAQASMIYREDTLAKALESLDTAEQFARRGTRLPEDSNSVTNSAEALRRAMLVGWYLRVYSESSTEGKKISFGRTSSTWKSVIADRAERTGDGLVYDWRVGVPTLMQLISLRLIVMTAVNPDLSNEWRFANDLTNYRKTLKDHFDKMIDGVRCNWAYDNAIGGIADGPYARVVCVDIYSGLSEASVRIRMPQWPGYIEGPSNWWVANPVCPFQPPGEWAGNRFPVSRACEEKLIKKGGLRWQTFLTTNVAPLKEATRRQVLLQMPLFEMRSMIDMLYLYANGRPDLAEDSNLIHAVEAPTLCLDVQWGNPEAGTPLHTWDCNGGDAQTWEYDRQNGTIRNPRLDKCLFIKGASVFWAGNFSAPGTHVVIEDCYETTGIDRPGNDYNNFDLSEPQPKLCRAACEGDSRCKAYTYVKPNVQGSTARCWLKDSVPNAVANQCCTSGTIFRFANSEINSWPERAQQWTWDPNTHVLQNGLGTVLDIQGGKLEAGTPVWTWYRNEDHAQRWSSRQ